MKIFREWGKKRGEQSPALEAAVPSFPDGIELLHDCHDAIVDICFIHGLSGNRTSTWMAPNEELPWPMKLLPPRLENARVLTYGYDAYVTRTTTVGNNGVADYARNFLNDLTGHRLSSRTSCRPLIIVAHSLGGLVCKKAILISRNHPHSHLQDLFDSIRGIVFLGTPHRGSWLVDWLQLPAEAFGLIKSRNMKLLHVLKEDNALLEDIRIQFLEMLREQHAKGRSLEITCFYEELPMPVIRCPVVPKASAIIDGYLALSIHANHRDMVKFSDERDNGFVRVLGELNRWVEMLEGSVCRDNVYFVQKHSSNHFVGRSEYISRMAKYFEPRTTKKSLGPREFVIYGPGGFGKTQLCLRFVEEYSKSFWGVFWIDASTEASLRDDFCSILEDRAGDLSPTSGDPIMVVCRWLSKRSREWLLILDNADDSEFVQKGRIPKGDYANILISTRNTSLRQHVKSSQVVSIETLDDDNAKSLLWSAGISHQYGQRTADIDREMLEIAHSLYGIPLALQHAASAIESGYSLWDYRSLLKQRRQEMLNHPDYCGDRGYNQTLYSAWSLSIDLLETKAHIPQLSSSLLSEKLPTSPCPAVQLLSLLSFFHHSAISTTIFSRAAKHATQTPGSPNDERLSSVRSDLPTYFLTMHRDSWDPFPFMEAVKALQRVSLIQLDVKQGTWSIHPLIHAWARDRLTDCTQRQKTFAAARAVLVQALSCDSVNYDRKFTRMAISHMVAFRQSMDDPALRDYYADDYAFSFWRVFTDHGYFAEAEEYALLMKDERSIRLGPQDRYTLKATETLALTMKENAVADKVDTATSLLRGTLLIRKLQLPERQLDYINTMILLGVLYTHKHELGQAEALLQDAWRQARQCRGDMDVLTIRAATELGSVYIGQGRLQDAESLQNETLVLAKACFGQDAEKTLGVMATLAVTLTQLGRLEESEKLKLHILTKRCELLGEDHPDTLLAQANLAATYCRQQRWQEAEALIRRVTDKRVQILGSLHRETLRGRIIQATCYIAQKRYSEAQEEASKALEGREIILGRSHPDTQFAKRKLLEALQGASTLGH